MTLNTTETEQTSSQQRREITPVLPLAGQKFPRYSEGYAESFAVLQNIYLFHDFSGNH
jgi:hypothetical protein